MDSKLPKKYVAELLKQLEELKRKKAHKERKLQKLKGCSSKDVKKERAVKASSCISIKREPDQINGNETSLKKLDESFKTPEEKICEKQSSDSINNLNYEKCHSLSFDNHKFNKDVNHSDVNSQKKTIIAANEECIKNHNVDRTTDYCNSTENDVFLKPTVNKQKTNHVKFENHNLSLLNDKLCYSVGKSPVAIEKTKIESGEHNLSLLNDKMIYIVETASSSVVGNPKTNHTAIHDRKITSNIKEKVKQTHKPDDLMPASAPNISKNFTNSSESENKLSNDSNKSLPGSKGKISDILDDSLNSNMSFFMSADLFVNDDIDKEDLIKDQNDNKLCVKNNEDLPPVDKDFKKIDPKLLHLDQSYLSVNGYQQEKNHVFNFPKFSTPTEGSTQVQDENDLIEKSPELSDSGKKDCLSNKRFNNVLPSTSNVESPLLNFALEKRLSSVLDAHYASPKKIISHTKMSSVITSDNADCFNKDISGGNAYKKRKLFTEVSCNISSELKMEQQKFEPHSDFSKKSSLVPYRSLEASAELDQELKLEDFDNVSAFDSGSNSLNSLKSVPAPTVTLVINSCDDVPSQVSKTVDGLVNKVCCDASECMNLIKESASTKEEVCVEMYEESIMDSEILFVPETEGLGLYFSKDTEEFLETSTLSESMGDFPAKENFLNVSSQSKLESPVVNNIVAAVKSSRSFQRVDEGDKNKIDLKNCDSNPFYKTSEKNSVTISNDAASAFENSLGLDTSFLEDDTQDLGNFKQVPYMNDVNINERVVTDEIKTDKQSNLKFMCSLSGSVDEPVMDVEIVLFNDVKYVVIQHETYICVWRQEKEKQWIKIFSHQIEDMLSLAKICISMDDDDLVIVMLLSNEDQYCLQFLIFEKDARVIKLMENSHWLEESKRRCSEDFILLCGLSGLMFAVAQNKEQPEVSVHAFISLKENPRLMTAVLGSTETPLCSLCKIDKLPNALIGISDSMLYVWHILEARLVTAVSLHPHDYIPIKECFWATVENGLIYFLTTCEGDKNHHICQLLAANLATGFCQSAMTYSTLPSDSKVKRIIKAAYQEPFLVVAHSEGAFIWSVLEEFCCATLPSTSNATSIAISRDFDNWGILAVGSKNGQINCYSLH